MPTLTSIAWERLIEPRSEEEEEDEKARVPPCHVYISPALYATPEPAPIPYSGPPSPSPYVLNHKRRRDPPPKEEREREGDDVAPDDVAERGDDDVARSVDVGERSFASVQVDFFDADEEFFSDGSTPRSSSYGKKLESELLATKLNLLVEIEKRKTAEEVVRQMYGQWQRLGNLLCENGLTLPSPPDDISTHLDIESLEQLAQEVVITRFVAEAFGRGEARAEAELDAEAFIQSKDQEISRLRDRLRYYEAVNHEMCQRNQEVMEVARKQRQRKKTQRRWLWSCIGISMAIGSSVIAFTLLPRSSKSQTLSSANDLSEASCDTSH